MKKLNPDTVRELAEQGLYDKEIADKLGCNINRVSQLRTQWGIPSGKEHATQMIREQVAVLLQQGHSHRKIAYDLGVSTLTVCKVRHAKRPLPIPITVPITAIPQIHL